jgi:hypothetical protein
LAGELVVNRLPGIQCDLEKVMLTNLSRAMILLLLIGSSAAFAQEQEKKPESISTEPKSVPATLKAANGETIEVVGTIIFTLVEVNSDETLAGKLVYAIADDARRRMAKATGGSISDTPASLTINNVIAGFKRDAKCPEIQIEINPMDGVVTGGRIHLDRLDLTIGESQQEVSKALCWLARPHREKGWAMRLINRRLKGEKEEQ